MNKRADITNTEVETALRALFLTEPTKITPFDLFTHCRLKTNYESPTKSDYESVLSVREGLIETNSNLLPVPNQETELNLDTLSVAVPVSN